MRKLLPYVSDSTALRLLKWSEFFYHFLVILPIIVVLYQDKGITVGDFFLIQGISKLASFLLEVPSGYLSDTFSRRKILILGAVVYLLGNAWLYSGYGFSDVAFAEILFGFAVALFSGTKESYLYDLLKRMGRDKEFLKENGALSTCAQSASFIAALIGGYIYLHIGNGLVMIETIAAALAVICVLLLPELIEVKRIRKKNTSAIKDVMSVVKMSVKNPAIKWFMLFPALVSSITFILLWLLQPTMEASGIALTLFGVFMGLNQFTRLVFSKYVNNIFNRMGISSMLKVMYVMILAVFVAILISISVPLGPWTYVLITFIVMGPATQKICQLVFSSFIHERIKSTERGTVMSVNSMLMTAFNALTLFAMKPLLDGYGLFTSVLIAGIAFIAILYPMRKVLKLMKV